MSKSQQNFPDDFPKLNFNHLQRYAKRWIDIFKKIPIKSTALYRYSCKFKLSKYAMYAVVFVVDKKIPKKVYEKFEAALACHSLDDNADNQKVIPELGIDLGFQDVYKERPGSNFLSEWQFLSKISGEKMPREIMTKEPHWVLFPVKDFPSTSPQDTPNEKTESGISDRTQDEKTKLKYSKNELTALDHEDFIQNLRIYYESNSEISIQVPRQKSKIYTSDSLGFKSAKTAEWNTLLNILQGSNTYYIGRAGKPGTDERKKYDSKRSLLKSINNKLINFLRKDFSLQIPVNFKLYELNPDKGRGAYKLIFQTEYDIGADNILGARYEKLSKYDLLNHLNKMNITYNEKPEDWLIQKIKEATDVLIAKHGMNEAELKNILLTKGEI